MLFSPEQLAYQPLFWICLFLIFLMLELYNGAAIFFLPLSLSAVILAILNASFIPLSLRGFLLADAWHWLAVQWIILALIISYGLMHYRLWHQKRHPDNKDINDY